MFSLQDDFVQLSLDDDKLPVLGKFPFISVASFLCELTVKIAVDLRCNRIISLAQGRQTFI